jgi:hypothetical protein
MFPFKTFCFFCEQEVQVARLSNNEGILLAYTEPHMCGKKFTTFGRLRLAWAILRGKPTGYSTDIEEKPADE